MIKVRGVAISIPFLGVQLRLLQEPKWLMLLRFLVFGFYPCFTIFRAEDAYFSMTDLFFMAWGSFFVFSVPLLFIVELSCWWIVYEDPRLQKYFGKEMNHIISLALYGSAAGFLFLNLFF